MAQCQEWAILLEVLCILGLDITMCLEGTASCQTSTARAQQWFVAVAIGLTVISHVHHRILAFLEVYESFGKDSDSSLALSWSARSSQGISQQATSTSLSVMGFSVALGHLGPHVDLPSMALRPGPEVRL